MTQYHHCIANARESKFKVRVDYECHCGVKISRGGGDDLIYYSYSPRFLIGPMRSDVN
jgi:hypothetical protein